MFLFAKNLDMNTKIVVFDAKDARFQTILKETVGLRIKKKKIKLIFLKKITVSNYFILA